MREVELRQAFASEAAACAWLKSFAAQAALAVASEGTLRKYPGSRHWHLRRDGEQGTLEATWRPSDGRFWFKIATNREGPWIDEALQAAYRWVDLE